MEKGKDPSDHLAIGVTLVLLSSIVGGPMVVMVQARYMTTLMDTRKL